MAALTYPTHFLHDIERMDDVERDQRCNELIQWVKRYADGNANPKWVAYHMFELAQFAQWHLAQIEKLWEQSDGG